MKMQPDLFEYSRGLARSTDPITSHVAAASVDTTRLETIVLNALRRAGRMTSFELSDYLDLSLVTVSPRMRPLANKGLIRDTGEKRINSSGRSSIVWEALP